MVGAPMAVMSQIADSPELEYVNTERADDINRIDDWAFDLAEHATDEVVEHGRSDLETYFGTVSTVVRHRHRMGRSLVIETRFEASPASGPWTSRERVATLGKGHPATYRDDIRFAIAMMLVDHVE
jgi:hypothetical protein